jgi:hypothetical protein
MTRNFLNIGIIFLLISGVTSCYVEQTRAVIENTSFVQKDSKWKIAVNPDYNSYYGYFYDKVSRKRITQIILADGVRWKVVEQFYKSTNSYYETRHSIPKFKKRDNNDILYGIYYLKTPDFKKISTDDEQLEKVRDSIIYPRISATEHSLFFWYSGLQYSLEFDSTGHFIKSVSQPTSDSPVPPHLYFGQYQLKGDTLELLTFGRKKIRSVVSHNKFLYDILLLEPKKEKYLMNTTRDTLTSITNKLYVPVKSIDTLRSLPINKDLSH